MAIRDGRWSDRKLPISRESTGLDHRAPPALRRRLLRQGGLVTLDELETSLHPRAIQVLLEAFRHRAREQNLRIVLATQSETVLDQFHECPEQIQVLEPNQEISPRSLTDMFGADWLSQFSLGDLFAHLEFGSNRERPAGP
jgi:predicted ATPase